MQCHISNVAEPLASFRGVVHRLQVIADRAGTKVVRGVVFGGRAPQRDGTAVRSWTKPVTTRIPVAPLIRKWKIRLSRSVDLGSKGILQSCLRQQSLQSTTLLTV